MRNLFFNWYINDVTGWGIYGYNLLLHGQNSKELRPVARVWPPEFTYSLPPFQELKLKQLVKSWGDKVVAQEADIYLSTLGNSNKFDEFKIKLEHYGVIFFEEWPLPAHELEILSKFKKIITGSTWNFIKLQSAHIQSINVIQGVDTNNFRPLRKQFYNDKFVVFSGGKLEFRKGQDILLKAFSIFAQKHSDAILVTAWASPWQKELLNSVNFSKHCTALKWKTDFITSIKNWAAENGIPENQFIAIEQVPNRLMPEVLREVDLAVFPNRCEGGTNLVAMEALASGVICAISDNTGHKDIILEGNCIPLKLQNKVTVNGLNTVDWGESSVDEVVDVMERVYAQRNILDKNQISQSMQDFTWENSIKNLYKAILECEFGESI